MDTTIHIHSEAQGPLHSLPLTTPAAAAPVEEKEEELAQVVERHAATELYVEELRSRVAKLVEREASTEVTLRLPFITEPSHSSIL